MSFAIKMLNGRFGNYANDSDPLKMLHCYSIAFQSVAHLSQQWNSTRTQNVRINFEKIYILKCISFYMGSILIQSWLELLILEQGFKSYFLSLAACNILVEGTIPFYSISNYGAKRNCTISAMTSSVVTIRAINVGPGHEGVNYDVSTTLRRNCYQFVFMHLPW